MRFRLLPCFIGSNLFFQRTNVKWIGSQDVLYVFLCHSIDLTLLRFRNMIVCFLNFEFSFRIFRFSRLSVASLHCELIWAIRLELEQLPKTGFFVWTKAIFLLHILSFSLVFDWFCPNFIFVRSHQSKIKIKHRHITNWFCTLIKLLHIVTAKKCKKWCNERENLL
jgi:hypothetical protein